MHGSRRALYASIVLAITVAAGACATSGGAQPTADATADPTENLPAWMTTTLRAVGTDTDFTIAGLRGQVVAIEPMAIWCVNCRHQQREARAALAQLSPDAVFYLSLEVDSNERATELAEYAVNQEFDWHFAIAPPEVSRSLADSFGPQILSPPSTPLIIVAPNGTVVEQHFGYIGADELAQLLREHAS